MPAVRVFSLYAAIAVLFDFLLQITCFVALLAIDARRELVSTTTERAQVLCCLASISPMRRHFSDLCARTQRSTHPGVSDWTCSFLQASRYECLCCAKSDEPRRRGEEDEPILYWIFKNFYAPFLLHRAVRPAVVRAHRAS